ncbi:DMT family transporter [Halorubellus litoreus]|uniref:EamA family transporter n=1 Tax=Halorubellus litoreus TaxID=755308 RepID=A0ABD5VD59_9EURY
MLSSSLAYGLLAMVTWGVWSVIAEMATDHVSPEVAMVVSYGTGAAIAFGYVLSRPASMEFSTRGIGIAAVAGVFAGVGAVAFYVGLDRGSTSVVTTVSALYFVVAAVIAVLFLNESASLRTVAGIATAGVAVWLLAG